MSSIGSPSSASSAGAPVACDVNVGADARLTSFVDAPLDWDPSITGGCIPFKIGTARCADWPNRIRSDHEIDVLRRTKNASEAMSVMLDKLAGTKIPSLVGMRDARPRGVDLIAYCIQNNLCVPVPWPSTSAIHVSNEVRSLNLTFAMDDQLTVSDLATMLHHHVTIGGLKPKSQAELSIDASVAGVRAYVPDAVVSDEQWFKNDNYHVLPLLIQVTRVDSHLLGAWDAHLSSVRPHATGSYVDAKLQRWYIPSPQVTLTLANGNVLTQRMFPIRDTPVGGGVKNTSTPALLHRLDQAAYSHPDFGRWINVDFTPLYEEVKAAEKYATERRDAYDPDKQCYYLDKLCAVKIPATWSDLFLTDQVDLAYLVLTELATVRRLEAQAHDTALHARVVQRMGPRSPQTQQHDPVPFLLDSVKFKQFPGQANSQFDVLLLRSSTLYALINEKRSRYGRENHLMRLDSLSLKLQPFNPNNNHPMLSPSAGKTAASIAALNQPTRFSMDVTILYEPLAERNNKSAIAK